MKAFRFVAALLLALTVATIAGARPGQRHLGNRSALEFGRRRAWQPSDVCKVTLDLDARDNVTLGTTPLASGTTPPAVTISGALSQPVGLYIQIDGAGARGTATFKWGIDNGSTFRATGVLTAATVDIAPGGGTITIAFAAGTYATDNIYQGTVATLGDKSGNHTNATQASAALQPLFIAAASGFNNQPVLRFSRARTTTMSLVSAAIGTQATYVAVATASAQINTYLFAGATGNGSIIAAFAGKAFEWFNAGADRYTLSAGATGTNILAVSQINGGALNGFLNGASAFAQTATSALTTPITVFGASASGGQLDGDLARLIVCASALGTAQLNQLHRAFGMRYGKAVTLN